MNELKGIYVPFNTLLGYIGTATSEGIIFEESFLCVSGILRILKTFNTSLIQVRTLM